MARYSGHGRGSRESLTERAISIARNHRAQRQARQTGHRADGVSYAKPEERDRGRNPADCANEHDDCKSRQLLQQILVSTQTAMNPRLHLGVIWRPNKLRRLARKVRNVDPDDEWNPK
jgi:hypothetical protein